MAATEQLDIFFRNHRSLLLAYDQGLEHGPRDFDHRNFDPGFILELARAGGFTGVVLHKGLAEKYYDGKVPLILKLNGKTSLPAGEPISRQLCSVDYAVSLGAKAVGYTVYVGSQFESEMFAEFGRIVEEAHRRDVPAIGWMYPRGKAIADDVAPDIVAYAARVGLELGADAVKVKYTGDPHSFARVVQMAGKVRVFMSGGPKAATDDAFLEQVSGAMAAGAVGLAVGRNVWQHAEPLKIARQLVELVLEPRPREAHV